MKNQQDARYLFAPMVTTYCAVFLVGVLFAILQVWIQFDPPLLPRPDKDLPKIFFYLARYTHIHIFAIPILGVIVGSFYILMTDETERYRRWLPAVLQGLVLIELTALWLRWFVSESFEPAVHIVGALMILTFLYMMFKAINSGRRYL